MCAFCFGAVVYEQKKAADQLRKADGTLRFSQQRYSFCSSYSLTSSIVAQLKFGNHYLMDVFGFTFAILIILYLSSMFTWKTVGIFAVLLTIMDIILVIGTGTMVTAAHQFTGLGLPVLGLLAKRAFPIFGRGRYAKQRSWFRRLLLCRCTCNSNLQEIWPKNRFNCSSFDGSCVWHLGSILE